MRLDRDIRQVRDSLMNYLWSLCDHNTAHGRRWQRSDKHRSSKVLDNHRTQGADSAAVPRSGSKIVRLLRLVVVGTYVKEGDNNRMKGGETGVVFWSKVYCLSMRDMGEAHILYINGR